MTEMSDTMWKDSLAKSGMDKVYSELFTEKYQGFKNNGRIVKLSTQSSSEFPSLGCDTVNMPGIYENGILDSPVTETLSLINQTSRLQEVSNTKEVMLGRRATADTLIGVSLCDEPYVERTANDSKKWCLILGTVILENLTLDAEELRRTMCSQLPTLPARFLFLTKEGWPLQRQQEQLVKAKQLVNSNNIVSIRKQFEKHRIGVITSSGMSLGFIFVDLSFNLNQVRDALDGQASVIQHTLDNSRKDRNSLMADAVVPKMFLQLRNVAGVIRCDYKFVERNGWPVLSYQEGFLTLIDILMDHSFCIQCEDKHELLHQTRSLGCPPISTPPCLPGKAPSQDDGNGDVPNKRRKSLKIKSKEDKRGNNENKVRYSEAKSVLISYVRAEAAEYALQLKTELCNLGFSVYLDVHEIKTGSDWQDALNYAVTHCYIFVPLITPRYGKTQWTNREIKLADTLGKLIIPVNFQDQWPPECLAIQFASTQYIPCRPPDAEHGRHEVDRVSDNRVWEKEFVRRVSREIAFHLKRDQQPPFKKASFLASKKQVTGFGLMEIPGPMELPKLIVISVHPKQREVARQLKSMFVKDGYQVWCSVDIPESEGKTESDSESCVATSLTPHDLPTIPEEEVFFSQKYGEASVSFGDNKRLSSVFRHDTEFDHRPLSRLISQVSDFGQITSLTPEKIEHLRTFQQQTDQAGVVVVVVSDSYTKSKTSQKQVFYCEHRKQVVMVKYDDHQIPTWFSRLMGNDLIPYINNPQFEFALKARVKRALNPSSRETPKDATAEAKMQCLVNFMKKNLPVIDECVYIAGSSKLQNPRSEEICKVIASELAKVKNITVVTGGFFGASDIVARTFFDIKQKSSLSFTPSMSESSVVHILPMKDPQDFTSKAHQQPDGSFEAVSYGKTMFLGDSMKERESAVARLFDTCILIEGGPGVAREVEEFIWNDHFVIPIISTGGAAAGLYGVPVKIFEIPPCVSAEDWSILSEKGASPEEVAKAVVNIVVALKRYIASHSRSQANELPTHKKSKKKPKKSQIRDTETGSEARSFPKSGTPQSGIAEEWEANSKEYSRIVEPKRRKWWQRFLLVFSRRHVK